MGYIYAINISIKFVSNRVWWRCSKNKITHLIHGFYTHFHRYTFSNKILLIIFFWILFSLGVKYLFESYFPPSQSPQSLYSILNYFSLHLYPSPPPPPLCRSHLQPQHPTSYCPLVSSTELLCVFQCRFFASRTRAIGHFVFIRRLTIDIYTFLVKNL